MPAEKKLSKVNDNNRKQIMKLKLVSIIILFSITAYISNIAFADCPTQTLIAKCSKSNCKFIYPETADWKISDFHDIIGVHELNFDGAIWEDGNTDCYYTTKAGKILVIRSKKKNPAPQIAVTEKEYNKWKEYNDGQFLVCGITHDVTECPF